MLIQRKEGEAEIAPLGLSSPELNSGAYWLKERNCGNSPTIVGDIGYIFILSPVTAVA
jgi:hypothetical protein